MDGRFMDCRFAGSGSLPFVSRLVQPPIGLPAAALQGLCQLVFHRRILQPSRQKRREPLPAQPDGFPDGFWEGFFMPVYR